LKKSEDGNILKTMSNKIEQFYDDS